MQTRAQICKHFQKFGNPCKYLQTRVNTFTHVQTPAKTCKHLQPLVLKHLTNWVISKLKKNAKPQETINSIFDSVVEYENGTDQADDITLMAVKHLSL